MVSNDRSYVLLQSIIDFVGSSMSVLVVRRCVIAIGALRQAGGPRHRVNPSSSLQGPVRQAFPVVVMAISDCRPRQKSLQWSNVAPLLTDHAFEVDELFLYFLQLVVSTEGLRAVVLELLFPVGERHGMHVVVARNLRAGSIGLKPLKDNLEFEFEAAGLAHSDFVGCMCWKMRPPPPNVI